MSELSRTTYKKFVHLIALIRRDMFSAEFDPVFDKTKGQGRVLAMLKIKPDISTKDLSYLMGIKQQSLNELLLRLEKSGYIERRPSEDDKRVMIVHLTVKGKEVDQDALGADNIFGCLTEEEMESFNTNLDKLIQYMEESNNNMNTDMDDEFVERMEQMRGSMSEEDFENLMKMRGGFGKGFGFGAGRFGRGRMPENMPGAERFDPDYSGPMPAGRGRTPWQKKTEKTGKTK
jgi:DNA-binding MarR family transcriptional regulator